MASTTATVMITDALKEILVVGEGETPSTEMLSDGLRMLNRICDTLANHNDFAFYASQIQMVLTGQQSFTIGPTGDLVSARPLLVESAVVDRQGITYPVRVIDVQQYDDVTLKALAGANTQAIYYEGTFPNGTVYCYPLATGCTLKMRVLNSTKQFASLTDQIEMPPGYEDALMLRLAVRMAPSYGKQVSPDTRQAARVAWKAVVQTNQVVPVLGLPAALVVGGGASYASFMSGG